jgi:uncharacterized protein (TIGR03382 family)
MVWNGSGNFDISDLGSFHAETIDEWHDSDVCEWESSEGTLTLSNNTDTSVFTFNGAESCDEARAAGWAVNGEDKGQVEGAGFTCSSAGRLAPATWSWLLLPLAGVLRRRRGRS